MESSSRSSDVVARRLFTGDCPGVTKFCGEIYFRFDLPFEGFLFAASAVHPVSWVDEVGFETSTRVIEALDSLNRRVGS
jgi:hypothetical protein